MKKPSITKESVLQRTKPTFKNFFNFYCIFALCCVAINFLLAMETNGLAWSKTLFGSGNVTDMFMDFFNTIRDAGNANVYSERNNIYPPLCILIFRILGLFVDSDLIKTRKNERYILQYDQRCMILFIVIAVVVILITIRVLNAYINSTNLDENKKKEGKLLTFFMMMSYPVVYCLERGNVVLICFLCTAFFVFFYRSKSKFLRELSFVALAVAAGLKLYPAVFGVLLLLDRRWKDAIKTVIYGILAILLPGLVFILKPSAMAVSIAPNSSMMIGASILQNESVIGKLLTNIMNFAFNKKSLFNLSSVSIENFFYLFGKTFWYDVSTEAKIACVVTEAIAAIALLFTKKEWQRLFLLCYIMLNIPSASSSYSLMFLIIPLYFFLFTEEKHEKYDWYYMITFTLLLVHLPNLFIFRPEIIENVFKFINTKSVNMKPNQWIATLIFQAMFFTIIGQTIYWNVKEFKKKKSLNKTSSIKDNTSEETVKEA